MAAQGYEFSAAMSNKCNINCFIYYIKDSSLWLLSK
jgi:hypothetical protein